MPTSLYFKIDSMRCVYILIRETGQPGNEVGFKIYINVIWLYVMCHSVAKMAVLVRAFNLHDDKLCPVLFIH